jgi:hypothetical protein
MASEPAQTERERSRRFASVQDFIRFAGGKHAIRRVLISNNGIAAVKCIRSIRRWSYETFGNEREVGTLFRQSRVGPPRHQPPVPERDLPRGVHVAGTCRLHARGRGTLSALERRVLPRCAHAAPGSAALSLANFLSFPARFAIRAAHADALSAAPLHPTCT